MPRLQAANNAGSTLAEDISDVATSFSVTDAGSFPTPPFRCTIFIKDPADGEIGEREMQQKQQQQQNKKQNINKMKEFFVDKKE